MLKELQEIYQHLEDSILKGENRMTVEQTLSIGKAMGVLSYLIDKEVPAVKISEETFSNCCGVPMDTDHSFCPGCHEHAVAVNENDEEVE